MQKQSEVTERLALGLGWFSIGLGLTEVLAPGALARFIGISDTDGNRSLLRFYGMRELAAGVGILSQPNAPQWLWGRVGGDLLDIASLGRALASEQNERGKLGAATAAVLGVTALDVICAQQLSSQSNGTGGRGNSRSFRTSITINASPQQVYDFWRDFRNFPRFMSNLESVETTGDGRSHWRAKGPAGTTFEWDAETTEDRAGECIGWRATEGSEIPNSGRVRFEAAPGGRGTIVHVETSWEPPMGAVGAGMAWLTGSHPEQEMAQDLRHLKQILEVGEVVHSDSSIHTGMHPAQPSGSVPYDNMSQHQAQPVTDRRTSSNQDLTLPALAPEVMQ